VRNPFHDASDGGHSFQLLQLLSQQPLDAHIRAVNYFEALVIQRKRMKFEDTVAGRVHLTLGHFRVVFISLKDLGKTGVGKHDSAIFVGHGHGNGEKRK